MSNVGLFVVGTLVTLLVAAAVAILVYGAILDGRDEAERREADAAPVPAALHALDAA